MDNEDPSITEAAEAGPAETDLRAKLDAVQRENEALLSRLKYLQADFENDRKRSAREAASMVKFAYEVLFASLLPVLDELDAAVRTVDGPTGEGLRMVQANLWRSLQESGLEEIPAGPGTPFDPYVHEAIEQVTDPDLPEDSIKDIAQKGYRYRERVLRPAHVIVVKHEGEANG